MTEQPDSKVYGVVSLERFPTYNRSTYKEQFGVQAPPFDSSRRPKSWLDGTALVGRAKTDLVAYKIIENGAYKDITMTAGEAATVNLTGLYAYPAYSPAATAASTWGLSINPRTIVEPADALAIAKELGGTAVRDDSIDTNWGSETRRRYEITLANGCQCDASAMLAEKYADGVGAPGKWLDIPNGMPVWIAEKQDDGSKAGAALAVPCRALYTNEKLVTGFMGVSHVERTDLADSTTPASGLTADESKALTATAAKVDALTTSIELALADLALIKKRLVIS
jgi:hypothetical protein